jgi:hypothetical protein
MQSFKMMIPEPKSVDELVEFIAQATKTHFERTGRGIDGSVLAYLVKDKYPGLNYVRLGISKLGDVVRIGEERKLISRNRLVQHLEVRPAQNAPSPTAPASPEISSRDLFVEPELWRAAVLSSPDSHSFMHRTTGKITQAAPAELERNRADASLVEVETIGERTQLQWLKDFLKSRPGLDDESEQHLRTLLRGRNGFDPPTARDWKYFRARKAVEHVKQWATRNILPEALVLLPPKSRPRADASRQVAPHVDEAALRKATLAALADLTLEELGKLRVPLELVYRHFAPK